MALSIGLPILLVLHSVWAMAELREMRAIFLRDRAAAIAVRIEATPEAAEFERLADEDPALVDVRLYGAGDPVEDGGAVASIRAGRELFRTETSAEVFRAYVLVHVAGEAAVARIDLKAGAPDALLVHGRHNVTMSALSGGLLMALAGVAIWSMNRASQLERRQMQTERLAELGALSAVLAHEIRNPLGAIKGFAQLARESAAGPAVRPLEAIVRESQRLERLVTSLLLYGRPQQPSIRTVSWRAIAADLEAHARDMIGARPIEFALAGDLEELLTDPDLLKQALLNLVRNAVEAIPEDRAGAVRVHATANADAVTITVEDDGPGLPDAVSRKAFAPFVSTKVSGVGLGLPISKKLVESLGGELRLSPGTLRGTRVEMAFHGTNTHR